MTKQEALQILIKKSRLNDDVKNNMLNSIVDLSESDIDELGKSLALQMKNDDVADRNAIQQIEELLNNK